VPEDLGGVRNWDYRYCWLRDAALTLEALLTGGYVDEALTFRRFLERVATGDPADIQIMYGIAGNAASEQFQLDVYGELVAVSYLAATRLGHIDPRAWPRWRALVDYVEKVWQKIQS
jgi:GH15 family glucan-1,4-alpha-glucosidase